MVMIGAGLAGCAGALAAEPAATGVSATNAVGKGAPRGGVRIAIYATIGACMNLLVYPKQNKRLRVLKQAQGK